MYCTIPIMTNKPVYAIAVFNDSIMKVLKSKTFEVC
jgi:hypothetical protein